MTGPQCFGGCSELCVSTHFTVTRKDDIGSSIGTVKKLRPDSCGQCCRETFTDADRVLVEFDASATPVERANVLSSVILSDFMFFEQDMFCAVKQNTLIITCCLCYCQGCLCPCPCCIPFGG